MKPETAGRHFDVLAPPSSFWSMFPAHNAAPKVHFGPFPAKTYDPGGDPGRPEVISNAGELRPNEAGNRMATFWRACAFVSILIYFSRA